MDPHPYYRRSLPQSQKLSLFTLGIDLRSGHLPPYPARDPSGALPDSRPLANALFDVRAAAAVRASIGYPMFIVVNPEPLLEPKAYPGVATRSILSPKCLAAMAFADYFPDYPNSASRQSKVGQALRARVSEAIMKAAPGWCGTFGPGVTGAFSVDNAPEGNYDMTQMWLLPIAYSYYDELTVEARERLITVLLARGLIQRPNEDDTYTSGGAPNDWNRAGYISPAGVHVDIPETENHVLMIATARYLTNQLLYQRDHSPNFDNRRNGDPGDSRPSCMDQVLGLLRNQLRNDFAEYNAKPYQEETRRALLNLYSYAYDAEVRLGARMVLDYISAHIAVSSNDLRRMVPFRRRNEPGPNIQQIPDEPGFMSVNLLDGDGADPNAALFALLAGNTRAWQTTRWSINGAKGDELTINAVNTYRLPPSIHDLFVNDLHRRFFQRLHRHQLLEELGQQRNCDNMEIYAGSPSYLITAGGKPAIWVIPGQYGFGYKAQNLGVAVPISFIPTGLSAGAAVSLDNAQQLIQFLRFSDDPEDDISGGDHGGTENYGVAPDFACGFAYHLPDWTGVPRDKDGVFFVNRASYDEELPGFFLAIFKSGDFVLLEAFDTWLHTWLHPEDEVYMFSLGLDFSSELDNKQVSDRLRQEFQSHNRPLTAEARVQVNQAGSNWTIIDDAKQYDLRKENQALNVYDELSFAKFQAHVTRDNPNLQFKSGQETVYTTFFGNRIHFVIWNNLEQDNHKVGSKIITIEYGAGNATDTLVDAGNDTDPSQFLSGTVLKSTGDAVVEIHNSFLGTIITLDWGDQKHLKRTSETGEVEEAGLNHEVWVDFAWTGPFVGDFFQPFNTLAAATAAVADGGAIKILPGTTSETQITHDNKRIRLVAPLGGVQIGAIRVLGALIP